MRRLAVLLVGALLSVDATADWTQEDTARQLAFTGLQLIDWGQTRDIAQNPNRRELNPILGPNPSTTDVDVYFAATTLGHYVVSRALPPEYRKVWQYVWIGAQAGNVVRNYQLGVRVRF